MQNVEYRPEPFFKAFLSKECLAAIVLTAACYMTIPPFDAEALTSSGTKTPLPDTEEIFVTIDSMKPMQLAAAGQYAEAQQAAQEMLQRSSHDVLSNVAAGNALILSGSPDRGLACLKKAVSLAQRNRYIRLNYAQKLADLKRYEESIVQYQTLSKNLPRWDQPYLEVAKIHMELKRPAEAADALAEALKVNENNFAARKMRGIALARSGKLPDGLDEYMQGLQTENQAGPPDVLKALVGGDWSKNIDRAVFDLQQQVGQRPDDYLPKLRLAQLYTYMGQARDAKELLIEARRAAPGNAEVQRTLAVVLKRLGENNPALSAFGLSVKLEEQKEKASKAN